MSQRSSTNGYSGSGYSGDYGNRRNAPVCETRTWDDVMGRWLQWHCTSVNRARRLHVGGEPNGNHVVRELTEKRKFESTVDGVRRQWRMVGKHR